VKKVFILIGIIVSIVILLALCVGIYKIINQPIVYFKGEVINIEDNDAHLIFTVRENNGTQHIVRARYIKMITYSDSDKDGYAYNSIKVGDYIEGNYYHHWLYKPDFAEKIVVTKTEKTDNNF